MLNHNTKMSIEDNHISPKNSKFDNILDNEGFKMPVPKKTNHNLTPNKDLEATE